MFRFLDKTEVMEVDTNPFPKLVYVDMITVNWASDCRESNVEICRDTTFTNVLTSLGN